MEEMKNAYLEQVEAQQQRVEHDLKINRKQKVASPRINDAIYQQQAAYFPAPEVDEDTSVVRGGKGGGGGHGGGMSFNDTTSSQAPDVRITGYFRWKTVVVPPNAYIVHTRKGHKNPLHTGLGISFGFNPFKDSFLVVPSAMQTILINAHCICKDLQGLLVQAYVQWIIDNFEVAYKKLDFTDALDPMRVVNVQLREQAEAAIKDKVSTMGIDEVLSDKQPIIRELTSRIREVAEGQGQEEGLGLRIVTVQIKEAVVSSARLWENLQKPFRAEREKKAKLAQLDAESSVKAQELQHNKARQTAQLQTESELDKLKDFTASESFDREQSERMRRFQKEQENTRKTIQEQSISNRQAEEARLDIEKLKLQNESLIEQSRKQTQHEETLKEIELQLAEMQRQAEAISSQFELDKLRQEKVDVLDNLRQKNELEQKELQFKANLSLLEAKYQVQNRQSTHELEFEASRQKIYNDLSVNHLRAKLLEELPKIASKLPHPKESKSITIGGSSNAPEAQSLTALVAQVLSLVEIFRSDKKTTEIENTTLTSETLTSELPEKE